MGRLTACLICAITLFITNSLFALDKDLQQITNQLNEYALRNERGLETHVQELYSIQNQLSSWHDQVSNTYSVQTKQQYDYLNTRILNFIRTAKKDQSLEGDNSDFKKIPPLVPGNDYCGSAYTVGNGTFYGHTSLANADGWASCYSSTSPDVWFLYTAPQNDTIVFTTAGSDYYTVLSIHNPNTNGCPGDPTDQIACAGDPYGAKIVLPVDAGSSYLVRVSGAGNNSKGNYVLTIGPAGFITGHVMNQITQAPIPNIFIVFYKQGYGQVASTITNANGDYVSPDLPPGTYFVRTVSFINFADELYDDIPCDEGNCDVNSGTPVIVNSNTVEGIDFGLNPTGLISGHVKSDGVPLNGMILNAYDSSGNFQTYATTGQQGQYVFLGLAPGVYYVRTSSYNDDYIDELYDNISCPGYCDPTSGTPITVTPGGLTPGIDFDLDLGGAITGTIRDSVNLTPLSDGYVYIFDSSGNFVDLTNPEYQTGFYALTGLPSGNYFVQTSSTDSHVEELYDNIPCYFEQCDTLSGTPIPVTIDTVTENIDFLLDPSGSISGTITDENGSAIPDVYVSVSDPNHVFRSYDYTDQDGKYLLDELETGNYYVNTSSDYLDEVYDDIPCDPYCDPTTGDPISVVTSNETTGIDFVLSVGGTISGTITDEVTLAPVENIYVYLFDSFGGFVSQTITDSLGQYTFYSLTSGNYFVLTSSFDEYLNELYDNIPCHFGCDIFSGTPVPATPGNPTTAIDFQLIPTGEITGTVKKASDDQPLSGINVEIYNSSGGYVTSAFTDSFGVYTARILTADNYYVVARPFYIYITELYDNIHCSGYDCDFALGTPVPADVGTVTSGIDFDLDIGGSISGTVIDEFTGQPIPSSNVFIYDSNGNFVQSTNCDQNGVYISDSRLNTGSYFVLTSIGGGYTNELYDNHPCDPSCDPINGDPVSVTEGNTTPNINFALTRPTISIDDVSIQEGDSGTQQMIFTVTMSAPNQNFVRVWFEDDDGTAYGNFDFQPVFGYVEIPPGNISATISVPIFGDTEAEPDETFKMRLTNADNATIIDNEGIGTILNDDSGNCPSIIIDPPTLPNGVVDVQYNVTLSASGGTPPYTFVLSSGTLPPGLSLTADVISGIPQSPGTYNFIISVTDSAECPGSRDYSITVDAFGTCQLMGDDFEDGNIDPLLWTIVKPDFIENGGEFIGTPLNKKAQALATGFAGCGANCTMDTTMQSSGGVGSKVVALGWYQDKSNKVEVIMNQDAGTWIIKQRVNGSIVAKKKGTTQILADTKYTVRISFDGQQFMLHVTGNQTDLTLLMNKAPGTTPIGTFGFEAKGSSGRFSSICVN
jgi:Putative Ig domain/Carboxypeptidase regulatory-like domain/Calx-beta domain